MKRRLVPLLLIALGSVSGLAQSADLAGYQLLATSVRTGDTEVFIADLTTGDMFNVTRSPESEDRYPCWSLNAEEICLMSDRQGATNLWICDADGAATRRRAHLSESTGAQRTRRLWCRYATTGAAAPCLGRPLPEARGTAAH